jgi:hypothetical protein
MISQALWNMYLKGLEKPEDCTYWQFYEASQLKFKHEQNDETISQIKYWTDYRAKHPALAEQVDEIITGLMELLR